jgi:hypothetical protein
MIDLGPYANVEYDEKTRRINRWMKVIGGTVAVLLVVGLIAIIANTDLDTDEEVTLRNDSEGTVTCIGSYRLANDERQLRETGRFEARESGSIVLGSVCSVFDRDGNYVSCLRVRNRGGVIDRQFLASEGDRRVKADTCVYPR